MPSAANTADALRRKANKAYWDSEETVEQIAARLGMSRNALYTAVEPTPAGAQCAECGGDLVFTNRSSRQAGRAVCASCGAETVLEASDVAAAGAAGGDATGDASAAEDAPAAAGEAAAPSRLEQVKEGLAAVTPERAAMIGGAAALGIAVGAAAAKAARKRS